MDGWRFDFTGFPNVKNRDVKNFAKLNLIFLVLLFVCGLSRAESTLAQATDQVFYARRIWPGSGTPVENAAMLVKDGKVVAVGTRGTVVVPAGATEVELGEVDVIPGLVAAGTELSGGQSEERTLTPGIRAVDGFDFFDDREQLLQSGVTTVQVTPGNDRLMPGIGCVVRLAGTNMRERLVAEKESLVVVLSEASRNPPTIFEPAVGPVSQDRPLEPTRPQLATLSTSVAGLRAILSKARAVADGTAEPSNDEVIRVVADCLKEQVPLRVIASKTPEIQAALGLAREFKFSVILVDCEELKFFTGQFNDWGRMVNGVVLTGETPGRISEPSEDELKGNDTDWQHISELMAAGVAVAIRSPSDSQLTNTRYIAGQYLADGLDPSELLAAVTRHPAEMMGVGEKVGSLQEGRYADFVVLTGAPFDVTTKVKEVFAEGKRVSSLPAIPGVTVVQTDKVLTGDGTTVEGGQVVVLGKQIAGVGRSVSAPAGAVVRSFPPGSVVVPGFIDLGAELGLGGPLSGNIGLQTRLGEQLNPDDPAVAYARKHGITTALLSSSSGSSSPIVAFKLGDDLRVVKDPVAIRFKVDDNVATSLATNERLLKAGKAYVESFEKYERDLVEYQNKLKEREAKQKAEEAKASAEAKAETTASSEGEKKSTEDSSDDKSKEEKKPEQDEKKTPKPAAEKDEITGTWEGTLEAERLPPQMKSLKLELVLEKENQVSGTVEMLRSESTVSKGSYDPESRALQLVMERRGGEVTLDGKLSAEGVFSGSLALGRMGTLKFEATRTVDKSKQPEPAPEKKEATSEKSKDAEKAETGANKAESEEASKDTGAEKKPAEEELQEPKKPEINEALEPYKQLFAGDIPAIVEARNLNALKAAAQLFAEEYKVRTILVGADDLARQADVVSQYDVQICVTPPYLVNRDGHPEANLAQIAANQGLNFGFQSNAAAGSGKLPAVVQFLVSKGLSADDALAGLTGNAASMLSEALPMGTLHTGNDADLVVLSGEPFEFSTRVLAVMIDGQWVFDLEEQEAGAK